MYHGDAIPGFPQHPHRGFETITATIDGIIDHADSLGNAGRYGQGDVQWMTAGRGVVHSEMFPLIHKNKENATRFFQIWLNLPAKNKMVEPSFSMFWNADVPIYQNEDHTVKVTVWAGNDYFHMQQPNNSPPPASWASDASNDVAIMHITIQPGGSMILPKAHEERVNRSLFLIEGHDQGVLVNGDKQDQPVVLTMDSSKDVKLELPQSATGAIEILLLQGKPIDEPVKQYGPFVMNTEAEIQAAFQDYGRTQFGTWPWPRDDMVFPREKGRFALIQGTETTPNNVETCLEQDS
jgi:hypothetical protein